MLIRGPYRKGKRPADARHVHMREVEVDDKGSMYLEAEYGLGSDPSIIEIKIMVEELAKRDYVVVRACKYCRGSGRELRDGNLIDCGACCGKRAERF